MITEPMLSTTEDHCKRGGLLICGTNYGLAPGAEPEPEAPWDARVPYFTHPDNRNGNRYVCRLIKWFEWWDIPLEAADGKPTAVNRAISQTNLFYDSSKSFGGRSPEEMDAAFDRLHTLVRRLEVRGILFTSARLLHAAPSRLGVLERSTKSFGRFWVALFSNTSLHVAIWPHPAPPASEKDVRSAAPAMKTWILETVLSQ